MVEAMICLIKILVAILLALLPKKQIDQLLTCNSKSISRHIQDALAAYLYLLITKKWGIESLSQKNILIPGGYFRSSD
uniref:Uncharacterized protein n=1 Tax=Rhizophagus irregularis (strain DAOM 181602 / DAOM 197198 / MUCL 43194) TaxID=747089 RepID=U9TWV2_RHIID